ncbi:flagellar hook assembly protein FlgD [Roseospira navarrensis]|uniref:Basal-body rod modification protein FlgD n=1 Tax=Roseospira navarrensis TaxID=140058 RepID=A0A7X1ZGF3_9PROT|nr:flagellar hook assembly protein FlgD [Roseospira navarrensis]MQX38084.1 flagellar hook assembly protein FlgD [Roseospira navarrensis]
MVGTIDAATIIGNQKTDSSSARDQLAGDMDTFLNLLTTQLKNQDPLSPMDSTEFTNQLVLFAQVEQQVNMNENLEAMLISSVKSQQAFAVSYLDNYVEVETDKVMLNDGEAVFTYGLSVDAGQVSINVKDPSGKIVRTFEGDPAAGLHKITWDGTDSNGIKLDDGVYVLEVSASESENADGELETWTTSLGKVTGVAAEDANTFLAIGDLSVDLDSVLGVFNTLPLDDVDAGDDITDVADDETADP